MELSTFVLSVSGVMLAGLIFVLLSLKFSKTGTLEGDNWIGNYYYGTTMTLVTLLTLTALFTNPVSVSGGEDAKGIQGVILFLGFILFLVGALLSALFSYSILGNLSKYKRVCMGTGIELNKHIGKFVITTRKDVWIKSDDPAKWELMVRRITPVYTWTDTYAELVEVTTIVHLTQQECNKEHITKLVKEYFDNRKTFRHNYLVEENETLTENKNDNVEVIIL